MIILKSILLSFVLATLFVSTGNQPVSASSGFQAGRIMDDIVFINKDSMTAAQIQTFLNAKMPVCDTWGTQPYGGTTRAQYAASRGVSTPFTCLKDYNENGRSAAQIIYDVGQKYSINPQVLIVLLQKEQALVTDDWPWPVQYRSATGYGCPDTAPCDSQYYGLTNQLDWAAKMFRAILNNSPTWYTPYVLGNNYIQYSPDASCGGSIVNIQNRTTQALYNYTPYQPNQGALAAGWGTAPCGAYGNRNFHLYFTEWFGSTFGNDTLTAHPNGTLIEQDNKVFLIELGQRRHIASADIFLSYHYSWNKVKPATSGDRNLPQGSPITNLNPSGLYRTADDGVYVLNSTDGGSTWQKQIITYSSFVALGYNWEKVQLVSGSSLPASTIVQPFSTDRHSNGQLINLDNKVYMIDHNTLRYVSAPVYSSYGWNWNLVSKATQTDRLYAPGERWLYRAGSILFDGTNLYAVQIPPTGYEIKRPIGPWDCYANKFKYNLTTDVVRLRASDLPTSTGPLLTCQ